MALPHSNAYYQTRENMIKRQWLIGMALSFSCHANHYPIQFSIPESKIVKEVPSKDRDFAWIIPGQLDTYIYDSEEAYYLDYQRSYFGITCKKGGWDCLRHYEILANGCIPYFVDLDQCHPHTMYFLPKEIIYEAMNLPGVCYETRTIDYEIFDHARYYEIVEELLEHTRNHLTTQKMAQYLLKTVNYTGEKPILFFCYTTLPEYLSNLTLIGLKQLLGNRVIDIPKIPHIYKEYQGNIKTLYGKGMSYTRTVEVDNTDRNDIEKRIKDREFGLIIYGSIHHELAFHDTVLHNYSDQEIVYLCGEDDHHCITTSSLPPLTYFFLREYDCLRTQ